MFQRAAASDDIESTIANVDLCEGAAVDCNPIGALCVTRAIGVRLNPFSPETVALCDGDKLASTRTNVKNARARLQDRGKNSQPPFGVAEAAPNLLRRWVDRSLGSLPEMMPIELVKFIIVRHRLEINQTATLTHHICQRLQPTVPPCHDADLVRTAQVARHPCAGKLERPVTPPADGRRDFHTSFLVLSLSAAWAGNRV